MGLTPPGHFFIQSLQTTVIREGESRFLSYERTRLYAAEKMDHWTKTRHCKHCPYRHWVWSIPLWNSSSQSLPNGTEPSDGVLLRTWSPLLDSDCESSGNLEEVRYLTDLTSSSPLFLSEMQPRAYPGADPTGPATILLVLMLLLFGKTQEASLTRLP